MYEFFFNVLHPSPKDLMLHYMEADSFVVSFSEGNVDDKHMNLSNLDAPIKTNTKVPGNFKHELGRRIIEEFTACHHRHIGLEITQIKLKRKE